MSAQLKSSAAPVSRRILTLDLLRGYFLLDMVLNHLNYWPNGLDWVSGRGQLFVSGAEGFFIISGIVLGIVRGRKLADKPLSVSTTLLVKRSVQLYVTYVISVLVFTLTGWAFLNNPGLKLGIAAPDTPLPTLLVNILNFNYIYGWADYLRLYALFIILSPIAVWLLRQNKWWIVMGASITIWAVSPRPDYPLNVGFQAFHWQLLFFSGLTIGYHWQEITAWWRGISHRLRRRLIASIVTLTVIAILLNLFLAYGGEINDAVYAFVDPLRTMLGKPFDKENLSIYRVLYTGFCFISGFWLFDKFEPFIVKYFGGLLLPFGTNSLYVYTVQAFFVFFAGLIVPSGSQDILVNVIMVYGITALIWLMIRKRILFKLIPR